MVLIEKRIFFFKPLVLNNDTDLSFLLYKLSTKNILNTIDYRINNILFYNQY